MHGKNPAGTTPFVELEDGTCLAESVAIVEYLDALYPDCGPNLSGGEDPLLKAQVAMWTQRVQLSITAPFQRQYPEIDFLVLRASRAGSEVTPCWKVSKRRLHLSIFTSGQTGF